MGRYLAWLALAGCGADPLTGHWLIETPSAEAILEEGDGECPSREPYGLAMIRAHEEDVVLHIESGPPLLPDVYVGSRDSEVAELYAPLGETNRPTVYAAYVLPASPTGDSFVGEWHSIDVDCRSIWEVDVWRAH